MLRPILINSVYSNTNRAFRKAETANTQPITGTSNAENPSDNFTKYLEEKDKKDRRNTLISLGVSAAIMLGTVLYVPKLIKKIDKNNLKVNDAFAAGFHSLKGDKEIPTLESCKSINKNLKDFLQNQVDLSKATSEDLRKTGMPSTANRLLMYGAPGSGKTFFAKIFAKTLDAEYMEIKYSDLNKEFIGEHIENLKSTFENILNTAQKNSDKKYVVNFNEIDALAQSAKKLQHGIGSGSHNSFKLEERSVFLTYIEDLAQKTPNVTLIGSTNIAPKDGGLDGAVLSRFKNRIEVEYPDHNCMFEALKANIKTIPEGEMFINNNNEKLDKFAQTLIDRKASYRDLNNVIDISKGYYLKDTIKDKSSQYKVEYLENALKSIDSTDGEINKVR